MNKKLLIPLFVLFLLFPLKVFAQESNISNTKDQDCIDLEKIYMEINNSSQAVTGTKNSIDAVKRVNAAASLMNIISVFVGEQIYCIKDEEAALRSSTLNSTGLLGMVSEANTTVFGLYPDINVTNHLAQMFVPGYGNKNASLAQVDFGGSQDERGDANEKADEVVDVVEGEIGKGLDQIINDIDVDEKDYTGYDGERISGYNYLKDIVKLDSIWKVTSGIAYVLFVIVFVVVGFMIMFRKNLSSNITVTVSKALPNLIVSLIFVTFSFAIVGFIMDIGKLGINVSRYVFNAAYQDMGITDAPVIEIKNVWGLADDAFQKTRNNTLLGDTISSIPIVGKPLAGILLGTGNTIGGELARVGAMGIVYYFLDQTMPHMVNEADIATDLEVTGGVNFIGTAEVTFDILQPIVDMLIWMAKNAIYIAATGAKVGLMATMIKSLVLIIISFYAAIRVFITLLTTYLKLFLNVILGPLQILLGAVPGNAHMMTNWLKSVVANTLVFVGIYVVINAFTLIAQVVDPERFNFFGNSGTLWPDILISLESIIVIAGYLFAANLPKVINGALGVEANKSIMETSQNIKDSFKKIPLVGGIFG